VPVTCLALSEFRNHASALIAPGPGFVLLSGDNGAGKTNVLEAVSLLAPGRGLRGAALSELWPSVLALVAFTTVMMTAAILRFRKRLD